MKHQDQEDDLLKYDDDEAVNFILTAVPKEYKDRITEEMVNYVLDVVYEYYDGLGFIKEDSTEEAVIDEDKMFDYIEKTAHKDKFDISEEEIELILDAEFEYGQSQGIYSEES